MLWACAGWVVSTRTDRDIEKDADENRLSKLANWLTLMVALFVLMFITTDLAGIAAYQFRNAGYF